MVQPTPAAHVMVDSTTSSIAGCGGGVMVVAFAALILAISSGSMVFIVIVGLLLLVALGVLTWTILEMRRWEPLELHFSTWPLELGSSTTVNAVRRAKQAVPDAVYTLDADLTCKESATYTVGTDTRTDIETVHQAQITTEGQLRDRTFLATFQLEIPHNRGAPTMDLGNNEIEWKLDIDVDELSRSMAKRAFTVVVVPVLDQRHHNIQDSPLGGAQ